MQAVGRPPSAGLQGGKNTALTDRQACTPGAAWGPGGNDPNQRNWPLGRVSSKFTHSKVRVCREERRPPSPELWSLGHARHREVVTDSARQFLSPWSCRSLEKPVGAGQQSSSRWIRGKPFLSGSPLPCSPRTGETEGKRIPGGPVVKDSALPLLGPGIDSWLGNEDPTSNVAKKKIKRRGGQPSCGWDINL